MPDVIPTEFTDAAVGRPMPGRLRRLYRPIAGGALVLMCAQALAHHGWEWAEGEQSQLKGTVQSVSMAPPHPVLQVRAEDGRVWQVDLGNPNQTARSGFTGASTKAGEAITVLGNRTKEPGKAHIKAVRILVGGKQFDMYPERIRAN